MAQPERILADDLIQFLARRSAPFLNQSLVASEGAKPVSRRGLGGGDAEVGKQVAYRAESQHGVSRADRGALHEMQMTVDETGRDDSSRQADQTRARTDERLEIGKVTERDDLPSRDSDGIAFGMPEDFALVQYEVNFIERHQRTLRVFSARHVQPTLPHRRRSIRVRPGPPCYTAPRFRTFHTCIACPTC